MYNFAILCKTCYRDIECLKLLLSSIKKYNIDHIPVCLCIAKTEKKLLIPVINEFKPNLNINIFYDEDIISSYCNEKIKEMDNWLFQQFIKLSFYKTNFAKHYLLIDSDCYFIQEFKEEFFLFEKNTPYFPITGHTKAERFPLQILYDWDINYKNNSIISDYVGYKGESITIDMPFIITTEYMKKLEIFIKNKGHSLLDILELKPYEMQWYLEFVVAQNLPYKFSTSFFLPLHLDVQYQVYRLLGFDENIIKKNYLGILMNKGHVKSIRFKPLFIGTHFIRPLLRFYYLLTKTRYDYKKETNFLQNIFSIRNKYNTDGKKYKIITILYTKIKLKIKNKLNT